MKTKKIKARKGFTIVELVIVIGVIGVLTGILVPTFINLNNKANQAADEALIKNLNTQLRIKETSEGKNKTLTAALADAAEAGYLVENLTPKSGKDIVWNQDKDEFSQLETAPAEDAYKYWKIYEKAEDIPSAQTYSVFAKGKAWTTVPTLTVGFDAGENKGIKTVNYTRDLAAASQEVVIRTNDMACDVTINAPKDVVRHYGEAQSIDVIAIKSTSYHEYGAAPFISVNTGRIVLEDSAQVEALHVESSSAILAIASKEALPEVTVEEGVTSFKVETTKKDSGETLTTSNVTVAANGSVTLDQQSTALSGNAVVETAEKEDAKGEAVANSDLVFQVNGSWTQVAANARAVLNDYLRVYKASTTVLPSSREYTPKELSDVIAGLKDYYVEAGTIHIDIETIMLNGLEFNSASEFALSVGNDRHVRANFFKIENGKLFFAAPVAAFELNTNETLKINKTNVSLGNDVENSLTVKSMHAGPNGAEFAPHTNDPYSFDISRSTLNYKYLSMAFNEISSSGDGPIITRKLNTYPDGTKTLNYGLTTVDGPSSLGTGNYGVWFYICGSSATKANNATHVDYSVYFMEADKTCALHFDIVE